MLRLSMPVLGVSDMGRALRFWSRALHYAVTEGGPQGRWAELGPADGVAGRPGLGSMLALQVSDSALQEHPRIHLDLSVADEAEQQAEVGRLLALGAEKLDWDLYPDDPDFVVLADTEGNRFCIVDAGHG